MNQSHPIGFIKIIGSVGSWKLKTIKLLDYFWGSLIALFIISRRKIEYPHQIKNILIIRPGGIGDAIFLLPILRSLKKSHPETAIHILCEKRNEGGFSSQKDCYSHLYCYDRFSNLKKALSQNYDLIIDTEQWHYFSALTAFFAKSHYRIGFNTRPLRTKLYEESHAYDHDTYELENFKRLFINLLPKDKPVADNIDQSFILSNSIKEWAQNKIPENTVSLFLGASIALRRLTREQTLKIINNLIKKNLSIALLGGKDIESEAEAIEKNVQNKSIYNFAGKTNLEESAALINRSRLFIGTDSGLMHLACAVGTPVIGIFGPGNLKKWGPQGALHKTISLNLPCSPCTFFGYTNPTCHGKYQCMSELNLEKLSIS